MKDPKIHPPQWTSSLKSNHYISEKTRIMRDGNNRELLWLTLFEYNDRELKQNIEYYLDDGSKINAIKVLKQHADTNFVELQRKCTLREVKDTIDRYAIRYRITKKIKLLRDRIEKWCLKNGYEKLENQREVKSKDGTYAYKYSDWEMVDDIEGNLINDRNWYPPKATFKEMNKLWRKYVLS